jgi:hypothetical protein
MATTRDCDMLTEELRELIGIRMAVVLVPACRALDAQGRGDLRSYIERFVGHLSDDLENVLSKYEVRRKHAA